MARKSLLQGVGAADHANSLLIVLVLEKCKAFSDMCRYSTILEYYGGQGAINWGDSSNVLTVP